MPGSDDPITGITGVRRIAGEQRRETAEQRRTNPKAAKPGKDSITISSRARRLADIEELLGDGVAADDDGEEQADIKT